MYNASTRIVNQAPAEQSIRDEYRRRWAVVLRHSHSVGASEYPGALSSISVYNRPLRASSQNVSNREKSSGAARRRRIESVEGMGPHSSPKSNCSSSVNSSISSVGQRLPRSMTNVQYRGHLGGWCFAIDRKVDFVYPIAAAMQKNAHLSVKVRGLGGQQRTVRAFLSVAQCRQ